MFKDEKLYINNRSFKSEKRSNQVYLLLDLAGIYYSLSLSHSPFNFSKSGEAAFFMGSPSGI